MPLAVDEADYGYVTLFRHHTILTCFILRHHQTRTIVNEYESLHKTYIELCKLLYALQPYSYPFSVPRTQGDQCSSSSSTSSVESSIVPLSNLTLTSSSSSSSNQSQQLLLALLTDQTLVDDSTKCINMLDDALFAVLSYGCPDREISPNAGTGTGTDTAITTGQVNSENESVFRIIRATTNSNVSDFNSYGGGGGGSSSDGDSISQWNEYRQFALNLSSLANSQFAETFKGSVLYVLVFSFNIFIDMILMLILCTIVILEWCGKFVDRGCVSGCVRLLETRLDELASDPQATAARSEDSVTALLSPILVSVVYNNLFI